VTRVWAGPSTSGTHQAGEEHAVSVGDVVVVPAGTAHRFKELTGKIEYLVFRFEAVE
jgi:quercetin dioxygenase-like cupin family protein